MSGKQSTLNDLVSIDKRLTAIDQSFKSRGYDERLKAVSVNDFNTFFKNGRYSLTMNRDTVLNPPMPLPKSVLGWFFADMKIHPYRDNYALLEVTNYTADRKFFRRTNNNNVHAWVEYLTTANTIIDANGFIKTA